MPELFQDKFDCFFPGRQRRFKKFQQMTLGRNDDIAVKEIDIRNYAKYLLREGTDLEKRELLGCLKGNILLSEKKILLTK